ncbi:MAG: hypothetical protein SGARI_004066 [Bacillariaceae sp.]
MGEASYIASVVATYWFVSISMVYLNKLLMSSEGVSISTPLFITWYQCVVTILICWAAGKIAEVMQRRTNVLPTNAGGDFDANKGHKKSFFSQFPKAIYHADIASFLSV